tara:strand:+ start:9712 stop:10554 length:843 start_codon:yes stop_codon:yes gene_type:complete
MNTIKTYNCAPNNKTKKKYSCYDGKSLQKLKKWWNIRHPDSKIKSKKSKIIWNNLNQRLHYLCSNERCWLKQEFVKNNITPKMKYDTFTPDAPISWSKNINEWLSSTDIQKIMNQYEKKYTHFEFIGPSPIDFDKKLLYGECVWNELCNFSLKNLLTKNKTQIGIIFNLDPHYKSGSHWVSLFVNVPKKYIHYYDSTGEKQPKEVTLLMDKIKYQANVLNIHLKQYVNKTEHQMHNTECGMYSLYFIIQTLEGKDPSYFTNTNIKDKEMEILRNKYFYIE